MYRVNLKDGRCFFAENFKQNGSLVYFTGITETRQVKCLDDKEYDGVRPTILKVFRFPSNDIIIADAMIEEIIFFQNHYIPMFETDKEKLTKKKENHIKNL